MYNLNPNCTIADRGDLYFIADTKLGKYYQINKTQFEFLQKYIGNRTINNLEDFVNPKERAFIEQLIRLEIVINSDRFTQSRKRFEYSDFLHFRIAILNPDRFCAYLFKCIKPIWRWYFILPVTILLIVSLWGTILGWNSGQPTNERYSILQLLLLIYATTIILSPGHELAHAVMCKAYGGAVQDMGIAFIYLNPCFYCNVSASYLFKKKKQRIMVVLVGILYDIFATAIAVIVLFNILKINKNLLEDYICFSILMLLFELNPLIKHDGYYVLAEVTSVYNLREKALLTVRNIFTNPKQITKCLKENLLYVLYGVVAVVYTFFYLAILAKSFISIIVFAIFK